MRLGKCWNCSEPPSCHARLAPLTSGVKGTLAFVLTHHLWGLIDICGRGRSITRSIRRHSGARRHGQSRLQPLAAVAQRPHVQQRQKKDRKEKANPPPPKKKKPLLRYQSSCADVAPLEHFKSLIEFRVRVRFYCVLLGGVGVSTRSRAFSLPGCLRRDSAGVQPRSAAGACVCGAACA